MSTGLTHLEQRAMAILGRLHEKYPNDKGFQAMWLGTRIAAVCRRPALGHIFTVDRRISNCFYYGLTDEGKARAKEMKK